MRTSPMLLLHIFSGTVGLLSGGVAVFLRKGSRRHRVMGNVFVVSMLSLAASGIYMAVLKGQVGNILGGSLTFYLVATGWMIARRRAGETNVFDWLGLLMATSIVVAEVSYGIGALRSPTGHSHGYPPGPYFIFGLVGLLAAGGDVRLLLGRGISGTQRTRRHLWRMCFGLFIAAASVFMARAHLFPMFMRRTGALYFLTFLPLGLMVFWLFRVRSKKGRNGSVRDGGLMEALPLK